ncbi:MAG: PIG-L family deacetylase [Lentisphaeria bacterium]|nr:PIG-L family deacetylase [Lentisphaeria bacterium]
MSEKRIIFIGAHPDDPDVYFGGTAIKLAKAGHKVKFLSLTNGDRGHHILSPKEICAVRRKEADKACRLAGLVEYEIFDIHDCHLEVNLENRKKVMRSLRNFAPDLVITHRPCDYHPDHRAAAQLVLDCAYICMVPHFCEDTPIPEKSPVFAHCFDLFRDPRPQRADAAIEFESVMDEKLALLSCHHSQFFEWLPWISGMKDFDPGKLDDTARKEHLMKWMQRFRTAADNGRDILKKVHGAEKGAKICYAETFEQSPYSIQLPQEEFQAMLMP